MDSANDFALALDKASQEVIGFDFAKLTKEQLELYESLRIPEHNAWVKLIEKRDSTARAEALREAADKIRNYDTSIMILKDKAIQLVIADKQESTCPACGRSWDMSRFNACECGASLADKQE